MWRKDIKDRIIANIIWEVVKPTMLNAQQIISVPIWKCLYICDGRSACLMICIMDSVVSCTMEGERKDEKIKGNTIACLILKWKDLNTFAGLMRKIRFNSDNQQVLIRIFLQYLFHAVLAKKRSYKWAATLRFMPNVRVKIADVWMVQNSALNFKCVLLLL